MTSKFTVRSWSRRVAAIITLALLFGLASPALNAPQSSTFVKIVAANAENKHFSVSGTVESVSYASNTVRINAGEQIVDVMITPTTAIEVHGQAGSIADIHRGRKIVASGVILDGAMVAHSIVLK